MDNHPDSDQNRQGSALGAPTTLGMAASFAASMAKFANSGFRRVDDQSQRIGKNGKNREESGDTILVIDETNVFW